MRWRPAEMNAFERLFPQDRDTIIPFIEFIMPPPKTDKEDRNKILEDSKEKFLRQLPDVTKRLLKHCGRDAVFIDVHLLDGDIRASALENILSSGTQLDIFSIPVVYVVPVIGTDADTATREVAAKYAKMNDRGVCIRVDKSHLKEDGLAAMIDQFVATYGLQIDKIDIFIDLQIVDENTDVDVIVERICRIPQLISCRSFILAGGAFPKDLTALQKFENHQLIRHDWKLWRSIVDNTKLPRTPIFSDYTIQHPIFYGYTPGASVSASVRYTNDENWEVLRGEALHHIKKSGEKGPGYKQYLAHARELIKQTFYRKSDFSFGDSEINRIATPSNDKTGNPQTWLTIGINHHLTLVARQIANLL